MKREMHNLEELYFSDVASLRDAIGTGIDGRKTRPCSITKLISSFIMPLQSLHVSNELAHLGSVPFSKSHMPTLDDVDWSDPTCELRRL